jgi:uncharacterized protein
MTLHISMTMIVQHLLFIFLLVVAPAWDFYDTTRLKRDPTSANRIRYYRTLCSWLWISAVIACFVVGWHSIFTIAPSAGELTWLFSNIWVRYIVVMILIVLAAIIALIYLQVAWKRITNKPRRYAGSDIMQKLSYAYLFPTTWTERRWWVLIGLTAGICEEVLFRGFLLYYLRDWMNLTLALLVAAVIFGLQHLYQGAKGVVSTAVVGVLFGLLFLLSGSLILAMVLHAALDLRLLTVLRPPENSSSHIVSS